MDLVKIPTILWHSDVDILSQYGLGLAHERYSESYDMIQTTNRPNDLLPCLLELRISH